MSWLTSVVAVVVVVFAAGGAAAADPPDTSAYDDHSCRPCHAATRPGTMPWDAQGVFPEFDGSLFGEGKRIPLDTTSLEWKVWQDVLPEEDNDRGKTCFGCHLHDARGVARTVDGGTPDIAELHRWLRVDPGWKEKTLGVWVDVDTYRTFLVATVKVLNYGSGHRVPVRGQIILRVAAVDANGRPLEFVRGHTLPTRVSAVPAPGFLYERTYADAQGRPTTARDAEQVTDDTRLHAGEHDEHHYYFLLPTQAPRGKKAWEVRAELVWRVDGKEFPMEQASADSPR